MTGNTEGTPEPGDSVETIREALRNKKQLQQDFDAAGSVAALAREYGMKYRHVRKMLADAGIEVRDPGKAGREARWAQPGERERMSRFARDDFWNRDGQRERQSEVAQQLWAAPDRPLYHWDRPGQRERQRQEWLDRIEVTRGRRGTPPGEADLHDALVRASVSFTANAVVCDGAYIVDILVQQRQLVIKADGVSHRIGDNPERDAVREKVIRNAGYEITRVAYSQFMGDAGEFVRSLGLEAEVSPVVVIRSHMEALGELNRVRAELRKRR